MSIVAPPSKSQKEDNNFRDHIATVDEAGKRIWMYPKKPKGWYYNVRSYFSWVLLALLFGMPFIKVNGDPLLLFNILERQFIIFSVYFGPQDFHLFGLAMLILLIFIILFTVVFGRLFCGWVCPQTIFMEMVFRKIEYWIEGDANAQKRLNKAPWDGDKIMKKGLKQSLFFGIAILVANTFLAYIIGADAVLEIIQEPIQQHLMGFSAMIFFSFLFYFVFAYMREQVCVTICPYGRMQGVMLDQDSIVVAYDFVRGEPRGRIKKKKKKRRNPLTDMQQKLDNSQALETTVEESPIKIGDCIDCKLCVQVCPTGIDIRHGTQLECINCTACMDACDEVMEKIKRPTKLIRYDSYNGIKNKKSRLFTPRVGAYSLVLVVLLGIEIFLLSQRADVETLMLRAPGTLYQEVDEQTLSNLYNYHIINKTKDSLAIEFRLGTEYGSIQLIGKSPVAPEKGEAEGALFIKMPKDQLNGRKNEIKVQVYAGDRKIDEISTNFLGPIK
ncbi:MAG: cytochrome c oxidase accessory protein CcoG [Bacteroidota bacterium]